MPGWVRVGSFKAAYAVIQSSRGGASGSVFSRMTEWDVRGTVNVENLASDDGDYRTAGRRKTGGFSSTHWFSSPLNVQVGMSIIGMEAILGAFGGITQNVREAAAKVLTDSAERIKHESLERVPYRDGDLYDSWYPDNVADGVDVSGDVFSLEIGYRGTDMGGVPYAWRQHEEALYEHPVRTERGRRRSEWKFLEYPANDERVRMLGTAIAEMKLAVSRMGGVGIASAVDVTRAAGYTGVLTSKSMLAPPKLVKKRT